MVTRDKVVEELNFVTDKLSTQVRTTALGIVVFVWGLLLGQPSATEDIAREWKRHLVGIGGAAVLVMFVDFLQYVAAYVNVKSLYDRRGSTGEYDDSSISYKVRLYLFYAKILLLIVVVVWLVCVLGLWLVG